MKNFASKLYYRTKNRYTTMLAIVLLMIIGFQQKNVAQISSGGTPPSFEEKNRSYLKKAITIPSEKMPLFDANRMLEEDEANSGDGAPFRFAKAFEVDYDFKKMALLNTLANGDKLYRLSVQSDNAYAMSVFFDQFVLPKGAKLFIYSKDKKYVLGAFTYQNNKKTGTLPTDFVKGNEIIIEYYEPYKVEFEGQLNIGSISHDYKNIFFKLNDFSTPILDGYFNNSYSCNIDIMCPEGADWQDEKHSVCRIIYQSGGLVYLCSGALINNTAMDWTPYFLTANHCIDNATKAASAIFYFNYESPTCGGNDGDISQTVSASTLKATFVDTDMTLLELSSTPPPSYNPYYAGWNRGTTPASSSTGIHHPAGDVKKISIEPDPAISFNGTNNWYSNGVFVNSTPPNTHWRIYFNEGSMQGGSSGSPLFDQNSRVVGQLHGGSPECSSAVKSYYGRFDVSWTGGGTNASSLSYWLDPINSGAITIDGAYSCPTNLNITTTYVNGSNINHQVSDYITANNLIQDGANITYDAGNYVLLNSVFLAEAGSVFLAKIEGCSAPSSMGNKTNSDMSGTNWPNSDQLSLKVSPNPTQGNAQLEYNIGKKGPVSIEIYNISGKLEKVIMNNEVFEKGHYNQNIDLSDLNKGIYIIHINTPNSKQTQKLVKL